jgi:glucosamine 6-phosphate synthetase-like amidotransferase/phosphosugar isomerase protein
MCGIVGILSSEDVAGRLLDGLKRLEYRGYDSAGIATDHDGAIERRRASGKLVNLANELAASRILAGRRTAARPPTTRTRTPPARSPWSTTASSRTSSRCATN